MRELIADIASQPETMLRNTWVLDEAYSGLPRRLDAKGDVVITGMASSLWAWHSASMILAEADIAPQFADTSEYLRYGRAADDAGPLIVTSRSGESVEILRLLEVVRPDRDIIAISASRGSLLVQKSSWPLCFEADEAAFSNTKSFTMTLCMAMAAAAGMAGRGDLAPMAWLKRLAGQVDEIIADDQNAYDIVAEMLARSRVALVTGRGHLIGVAQQAALDLQEGMRIGAIAVPGGLMRHGPLELTKLDDCVVLLLVPTDHVTATFANLAEELRATGARVAALASASVSGLPTIPVVRVPDAAPELNPILFGVALQKLNVALGRALGLSVIEPALVAKITSVE